MRTPEEQTEQPITSPETPTTATPKQKHPLAEVVQFAVIALLIVLPVRWFIAQPFIVSGASMENTFHTGEYLIVDQLTYHFEQPQAGDIVIFRYPKKTSVFFIKRIIGVPGDTIDIKGNVVTITNKAHPNGYVLTEPYIKSMAPDTFLHRTLGKDEYFVMGDNRDRSSDSRVWGTVPRSDIVGRAYLRLFPFNKVSFLPGEHHLTGSDASAITQGK